MTRVLAFLAPNARGPHITAMGTIILHKEDGTCIDEDVTLFSDEAMQVANEDVTMLSASSFAEDDLLDEVAAVYQGATTSHLPAVNHKLDFSILHVPEVPQIHQRRFNILRCRTRQNICRADIVHIVDITFEFFNNVDPSEPAYVVADLACTGMMSFDAMKLAASSLRARRNIIQTRNVATVFRFERNTTFFGNSLWRIFSDLYKPVRPVFLHRTAGDTARHIAAMEEKMRALSTSADLRLP